jgi:hypothetical protein
MDSQHRSSHCIEIPPALAAAIVAAQRAGESLRRDSTGDKGKYTTADEIAFVARKALTDHGAAWVRLDVSLESCALASSDIGKQAYVGDLVERWAIVHEGGGVLLGSSRMPVITSMGRPHDKAVGASLTYDVGGALRGALCMDREDKNAIDRREDDRPEPEPAPKPKPAGKPKATSDGGDSLGPRCTGKAAGISKAIGDRMRPLVALRKGKATEVWADVLAEAGVDVSKYGATMPRSEALTIADGQMVAEYLARLLDEQPADMEALRNECSKLWVQICKGDPGFKLDEWKAEWAGFAQIDEWPDRPTAAHLGHAIAGMTRTLEKIHS